MPELVNCHTDKRIKRFFSLKGISADPYIISEGLKIVQKMHETIGVDEVLTTNSFYQENIDFLNSTNAKIFIGEDDFIKGHIGYNFHRGLFATANHPGYSKLDCIEGNVLILNNLDNAENVGALIRSALGLGFKNILIDQSTCSPYLKRSIRVSMGNVFFAKVFKVDNLALAIEALKTKKYQVLAAANEAGAIDYHNGPVKTKAIGIIIGNEGHGIEAAVKNVATSIIKIPVASNVEHLNAAAAGAILMAHFGPT